MKGYVAAAVAVIMLVSGFPMTETGGEPPAWADGAVGFTFVSEDLTQEQLNMFWNIDELMDDILYDFGMESWNEEGESFFDYDAKFTDISLELVDAVSVKNETIGGAAGASIAGYYAYSLNFVMEGVCTVNEHGNGVPILVDDMFSTFEESENRITDLIGETYSTGDSVSIKIKASLNQYVESNTTTQQVDGDLHVVKWYRETYGYADRIPEVDLTYAKADGESFHFTGSCQFHSDSVHIEKDEPFEDGPVEIGAKCLYGYAYIEDYCDERVELVDDDGKKYCLRSEKKAPFFEDGYEGEFYSKDMSAYIDDESFLKSVDLNELLGDPSAGKLTCGFDKGKTLYYLLRTNCIDNEPYLMDAVNGSHEKCDADYRPCYAAIGFLIVLLILMGVLYARKQ